METLTTPEMRVIAPADPESGSEVWQRTRRFQKLAATFQLAGVNFIWNASKGLIVVGLPMMTAELSIPPFLAFWPSSVPGLATASVLLLAGAIADVVGPKPVNVIGCFLNGVFLLACGLSRRGEDLVVLRALSGMAIGLHLSSAVAIVARLYQRGKGRNLSFACLGMSQVLGYSFGLITGGVLVDTIGWRCGWYLYGGINLILSVVGFLSLPKRTHPFVFRDAIHDLATKIDWLGALLASVFMALISSFLAVISTDVYRIKEAGSIILLCLGASALPLFIWWMHHRVQAGKLALVPNSFWRNASFTSICAATALSFAVLNSVELFASLFFQNIQHLSGIQTSIRILPSAVVGAVLNLMTGLIVHKIPAIWLIVATSLLSAGAPLLMALIQPDWSYWKGAFFAQVLTPFSVDVLLTIGLLIVSEAFPEENQSVAGAVFNATSQFGTSLGLTIMQIVSTLVANTHQDTNPPKALLQGYRASFWTMLSLMLISTAVAIVGLRKTGKVGLKHD